MIFASLLSILYCSPTEPIRLKAEESVWVYSHASSPGADEFLRIWGIDGFPVPATPGQIDDYSFGYLKFNLGSLPQGQPKRAILILHTASPAPFSQDQAKQFPLQARGLVGEFDASTWSFSQGETVTPTAGKDVFGNSVVVGDFSAEKSMELDIDLLKGVGKFGDLIKKDLSSPKHTLFLALTTGLSPSTSGSGAPAGIYKVYSASTKAEGMAPQLLLEY